MQLEVIIIQGSISSNVSPADLPVPVVKLTVQTLCDTLFRYE